ncbi:TauD/TfdA family dioxygenase [Chitinimonas koreensis]|uniref:TauD/TfdA family dioxygenase n=1 Tax=Chitinimonas koreensis TaxID=356302 RepID=UPI00041E17B0|nr:TauD/TfdA family dioxygenase [Chitinimonas koreensis]QNM96586.1 TauD/TfdA family dioxygenase [Chitinimonas koreensis]
MDAPIATAGQQAGLRALPAAELADGFAAMIDARPGQALDELDGAAARAVVQRSGALLLRGFSGGQDGFERFSRSVAERFVHNGNDSREALGDGGKTRSVTPGHNFVGPHSEFSYMPFRPDLLFFYCARPARTGGASLLWDGVRLWDALPETARAMFLDKRLHYRYRAIALDFFAPLFGTADHDAIFAALMAIPGAACLRSGDRVDFDYSVPAQVHSLLDGRYAFSNSIAVFPQTAFDDGTTLDPALRADLLELALRQTVTLELAAGDVLIVDNWRAMHGRTAFDDAERRICIRMGYLGAAAPAHYSAELEEIEY